MIIMGIEVHDSVKFMKKFMKLGEQIPYQHFFLQ